MDNYKLIAIAAVSVDGAIGIDNEMPWRIPEDFKHFRNTTMGHVLIVGYNTYLSLPDKAFEGRTYLVLCGHHDFENARPNVYKFDNLQNVLLFIEYNPLLFAEKKIFLAGGAMLYDSALMYCDEAIITWVNKLLPEANKRFPVSELITNFALTSPETEEDDWSESKTGMFYKINNYKRI
jgi:dihydrofolate reductase